MGGTVTFCLLRALIGLSGSHPNLGTIVDRRRMKYCDWPSWCQVCSPQPITMDRGYMRYCDWPSWCQVPSPQPVTTAWEVGSCKELAARF